MKDNMKQATVEQTIALLGHLKQIGHITIGTLQNGLDFDVMPIIELADKADLIDFKGVSITWNN